MKYLACFVGILFSLCAFQSAADPANIVRLKEIADSDFRSEKNRQRNQYRNPAETLDFFGIKPDMNVLELWPVKGWYTEILGPYLADSGSLTVANFSKLYADKDRRKAFWSKIAVEYKRRLIQHSDYLGPIKEIEFDPELNPTFGEPETFDMVLEFRSAHVWDKDGYLNQVFQEVFSVLKPGGIFGVVEHRADSFSEISSHAMDGYMDENYLISVAQKIGFELEARSGINANPKDLKNYPRGVFCLPPVLAMGERDKEMYLQIGESDRMTLKFVKPLTNNTIIETN